MITPVSLGPRPRFSVIPILLSCNEGTGTSQGQATLPERKAELGLEPSMSDLGARCAATMRITPLALLPGFCCGDLDPPEAPGAALLGLLVPWPLRWPKRKFLMLVTAHQTAKGGFIWEKITD